MPAAIAASPQPRPRQRCTTSRSTSAAPTVSTPDGASSPGATGTRHGPPGTQTVPDVQDHPVGERNEAEEGGERHRADPDAGDGRHQSVR